MAAEKEVGLCCHCAMNNKLKSPSCPAGSQQFEPKLGREVESNLGKNEAWILVAKYNRILSPFSLVSFQRKKPTTHTETTNNKKLSL